MEARGQSAALALIEWREGCARALDRPRRWICSDDLLLRIARDLPTSPEALLSTAEMPKRLAERFGNEILAAVTASNEPERLALIDGQTERPRPDKNGLRQLQDRARLRAEELGVQPEVLATRRELSELLVGTPPERISSGWRQGKLRDLV